MGGEGGNILTYPAVLQEPRVQLKLGLNRTKRIPTSVPTTQPQSSKVSCAAGPARPDGKLKRNGDVASCRTATQADEPVAQLGAAGDLTMVRPAAAAPPRPIEQVEHGRHRSAQPRARA